MKSLSIEKMENVEGGYTSAACTVEVLGGVSVIFGIAAAAGPVGWGLAIFAAGIYAADLYVNGSAC